MFATFLYGTYSVLFPAHVLSPSWTVLVAAISSLPRWYLHIRIPTEIISTGQRVIPNLYQGDEREVRMMGQ